MLTPPCSPLTLVLLSQLIAVSTDSHFTHLAWINTPRTMGGLGKMNIPVLSDMTKQISRDYGVLLEAEGVALRYGAVKPAGILFCLAQALTVSDSFFRSCVSLFLYPSVPVVSSSLIPRACCARSPSTTCRSAAPSTRPSASSRHSSIPTATARVRCPDVGRRCSVGFILTRMPWFFPRCFSLPNSLPGRLEARQRDGASGRY